MDKQESFVRRGWEGRFPEENGPVMLLQRASVVHLREISHQNALKSHSLRTREGRTLPDNIITDYYIHHMFWNKAQWFRKCIRSLQLDKGFLFSMWLPAKLVTKASGSPVIPGIFHKPKFGFHLESTVQRTLLFSPNKFTFVIHFLSILLLP